MEKVAALDIDGTLFRWQLFRELVFELINLGAIDQKSGKILEEKFVSWRALKASWRDYEDEVVNVMLNKIIELSPSIIDLAAQNVIKKSGHKVYNYTSNLIKRLKNDNYYLVAITGSPQEIAEPFASLHGFDTCLGVAWKKDPNTGLYTAEYERSVIGQKDKIFIEFIKSNGFSKSDSYGVGDTMSDYPLLSNVDNPIAFNPDNELLQKAKEHGWDIVVERKNIAYRMKREGEYLNVKDIITF